jgi:L-threonylcarbamoyladenylate synthase
MKNLTSSKQAVDMLLAGGVGVMPTDTVYGIVACAANAKAVARLYAIKHREHKPGTVIAANIEQLIELGVDERYLGKVRQWWPGPLSVETPFVSDKYDLDQETGHCAWRVVADQNVRQILEQTGPLVTSSANQPGEPVSVNVKMAYDYFGDTVDFYVDGGDIVDRLPSTVIRAIGDDIEIIRRGAVEINERGLGDASPIPAECPFCLINKKLPGEILYATEDAYLIEAQSQPGRYLIVPQLHVDSLDQLSDVWWAQLKEVLTHVPNLTLDYNLSVNIGKLSGQTVGLPSSSKGLASLIVEIDRLKTKNTPTAS